MANAVSATANRGTMLATRISDPRSVVNPAPSSRWTGNLMARHATMHPRRVDRGALGPVNGIRQILPSGRPGGVPFMPAPILFGFQDVPLIKVSPGLAARQRVAMLQERYRLMSQDRPLVKIAEGLTPTSVARHARNLNRGWIGKSRQPVQRGISALHLQTPVDKLAKFAGMKQAIESARYRPEILATRTGRVVPVKQVLQEWQRDPAGARPRTENKPITISRNQDFKPKGRGLGRFSETVRERIAGPSATNAPATPGTSPSSGIRAIAGRLPGRFPQSTDVRPVNVLGQFWGGGAATSSPSLMDWIKQRTGR